MKTFAHPFLWFVFIALTGCLSSPVTPPVEEEHSPRLVAVQNGDGDTLLTWESDSSYLYTIYYRDGSGKWKELRTLRQVRGTGRTMKAYDSVDPSRKMRRYRLHFEKPSGYIR